MTHIKSKKSNENYINITYSFRKSDTMFVSDLYGYLYGSPSVRHCKYQYLSGPKIKKLLSSDEFFSGGVFVIVAINIGPKELHRRISRSKPVCVVAAPCDQLNSKLLDVVDQVRYKRNRTFLTPSRVPLLRFVVSCSVVLWLVNPCERGEDARCLIMEGQLRFLVSLTCTNLILLKNKISVLLCLLGWFVEKCCDVHVGVFYFLVATRRVVFISVKQEESSKVDIVLIFFLGCGRYLGF